MYQRTQDMLYLEYIINNVKEIFKLKQVSEEYYNKWLGCIKYPYPLSPIVLPNLPLNFENFQKVLGIYVKLSTTFHLQINGKADRTIQTLEDMLRDCVIDFKGNWDDNLLLIFDFNNSYHSNIGMDSFDAFYSRRCRYHECWFVV